MRTRFRRIISLLLAVLVLPCSVEAQDAVTSTTDELQPIFSDDFIKDTRGDYTISGEVSWKAGHLTLPGDTSIGRAIHAGAWVRVDLSLDLPQPTAEHPESELQLWFDLNEATDCFVRLRRTLTDQGSSVSVALFDTGEKDGKPVSVLIREAALASAAIERLIIEYRYGLAQVKADNVDVMTAYIQNGNAEVADFTVRAGSATRLKLNHVSTAAVRPAAPLTAEQRHQLDTANAADTRMTELYRRSEYSEAATIGEEVVEIRTSVLGPDQTIPTPPRASMVSPGCMTHRRATRLLSRST